MELFVLMFKLAGEPEWTPYLDMEVHSALSGKHCQEMVLALQEYYGDHGLEFYCQPIGVKL